MTKVKPGPCKVEGCDEPRHVAWTDRRWAWLCSEHERMFHVIEREVYKRRGHFVGSTDLFRRLMRAPDEEVLAIIQHELGETREGARALLDRLEEARLRTTRS